VPKRLCENAQYGCERDADSSVFACQSPSPGSGQALRFARGESFETVSKSGRGMMKVEKKVIVSLQWKERAL